MVGKAEQSEATRRVLLDAARRLFTEHGFAKTSVESVVRAAGVTKGALYHQFTDKRALFEAVFEEVEQDVVARLTAAVADVDDPLETLHVGTRAFLDACLDPAVRRIALVEAPAILGWKRWRELERAYGLGLAVVGLEAAMEADVIRRQPVEPLAHVLFGALVEAGLVLADHTDPDIARREIGQVVAGLIDGFAK
jgi:AcrR family transcriptional regulator